MVVSFGFSKLGLNDSPRGKTGAPVTEEFGFPAVSVVEVCPTSDAVGFATIQFSFFKFSIYFQIHILFYS